MRLLDFLCISISTWCWHWHRSSAGHKTQNMRRCAKKWSPGVCGEFHSGSGVCMRERCIYICLSVCVSIYSSGFLGGCRARLRPPWYETRTEVSRPSEVLFLRGKEGLFTTEMMSFMCSCRNKNSSRTSYTFKKVRNIRGSLEGLALMI